MNKVIVSGRLTRDFVAKVAKNEKEILFSSVAVKKDYKNADGKYLSDFFDITVMNEKLVEFATNWLSKGDFVEILGTLSQREYNGNKKVDIIVDKIDIISCKKMEAKPETETDNEVPNLAPANEQKVDIVEDDDDEDDFPWGNNYGK